MEWLVRAGASRVVILTGSSAEERIDSQLSGYAMFWEELTFFLLISFIVHRAQYRIVLSDFFRKQVSVASLPVPELELREGSGLEDGIFIPGMFEIWLLLSVWLMCVLYQAVGSHAPCFSVFERFIVESFVKLIKPTRISIFAGRSASVCCTRVLQ